MFWRLQKKRTADSGQDAFTLWRMTHNSPTDPFFTQYKKPTLGGLFLFFTL